MNNSIATIIANIAALVVLIEYEHIIYAKVT